MNNKSRPTFSFQIKIDPHYGLEFWYWFRRANGFTLNFGFLGIGIFIQFVKRNQM